MFTKSDDAKSIGRVYIYTNLIVFLFIYLMTEALSLFSLLTRRNVIICWGVFGALLITFIVFKIKNACFSFKMDIKRFAKANSVFVFQLSLVLMLVVTMFIMSITIVPYNGDSMAYHLPRIMNWVQNKSVAYYLTNEGRQLYSPPFAEYCVMQMYFFTHSDKLFNLIQWYTYVSTAFVIYCILRKRSIAREFSMVGSILFLTMPIAIAESTTTQTDLVSAMFLSIFVYCVIDLIEAETLSINKTSITQIAMCSISIGLGYLTKSQICVPMIIFLIWMAVVRLRKRDKISHLFTLLIIAGAIVAICVTPSMIRNMKYTGDIFASSYFSGISIGTYNIKYVVVNIVKNWATASLSQASPALNALLLSFVHFVVKYAGIDIDDSRINFGGCFDNLYAPSYECDFASAPFIGIGLAISIVLLLILLIRKNRSENSIFEIIILLSAIPSFAIVRWQMWTSRLLLPTLVLVIIFMILIMNEYKKSLESINLVQSVLVFLPIILMFSAWSTVYYHEKYLKKSLEYEDRNQMYFTSNEKAYSGFGELVNYVNTLDVNVIGNICGFEYPIWTAFKSDENSIVQVFIMPEEEIEKFNLNRQLLQELQSGEAIPEIIISEGNVDIGEEMKYLDNDYICSWKDSTCEYFVYSLKNR